MDDTKKLLDLFPLNSVVFPHQRLSLRIFEPRYLKLIEICHSEARSFGVCLIREGREVGHRQYLLKLVLQ
ncbi:MAG: hypothetical protein R2568_01780 [Candidatus Scalindua sp.]|nr:hypothetical protein [Candidatus Scalindua sp.]MDV5165459.1 hypothetical protein [Candidatus Scalindua sp.]